MSKYGSRKVEINGIKFDSKNKRKRGVKGMIEFVVKLPPISKKNSQQILMNKATGKPFIMPSKKNITEEMADVEIMMEQVRLILGITNDEVQKMKSYKLSRTAHRYGLIED